MFKSIRKSIRKISSKIREIGKEKVRSKRWQAVRDEHLSEHGECAACGSREELQVHHIAPFHLFPELELEPSNLITLCMGEWDCHLALGHGGSFKAYNEAVLHDVLRFAMSVDSRANIIAEAKTGRRKI